METLNDAYVDIVIKLYQYCAGKASAFCTVYFTLH